MGYNRSPENNNSTCKNVVLQNLVFNDHLGSSNDPCYIQNCVIMNRVIKRPSAKTQSGWTLEFHFCQKIVLMVDMF